MRTALTAAATVALLAASAGCASEGQQATPGPAEVDAVANTVDGPAATSADLLQCLVQGGVEVWGTDQRTTGTAAAYVEAETSTLTLADGLAKLWVFADAASAEGYAEYAFRSDLALDLEAADATYTVHGNVALTAEHPVTDARVLDCLPGAATPTTVLPPAGGTVTFGSLMACGRSTGLGVQGDANTPEDLRTGAVGSLTFRDDDGSQVLFVEVYPDAARAAARDKRRTVPFGNTLANFDEDFPRTSPEVQAVLGCLPQASAAAPAALADEAFVVTEGTTPEELLACVEAIGYLPSPPWPAEPYGVDAPVVELDVYGMKGGVSGQLDQAAYLYVFGDPATAAANAAALTNEDADQAGNQYGVHGNVVRAFNSPPADPPGAEEQAVLDCLPPQG